VFRANFVRYRPHERHKSQGYFTVRIGEGQVQTRKRMAVHLRYIKIRFRENREKKNMRF